MTNNLINRRLSHKCFFYKEFYWLVLEYCNHNFIAMCIVFKFSKHMLIFGECFLGEQQQRYASGTAFVSSILTPINVWNLYGSHIFQILTITTCQLLWNVNHNFYTNSLGSTCMIILHNKTQNVMYGLYFRFRFVSDVSKQNYCRPMGTNVWLTKST